MRELLLAGLAFLVGVATTLVVGSVLSIPRGDAVDRLERRNRAQLRHRIRLVRGGPAA